MRKERPTVADFISPDELHQRRQRGDAPVIVDVRGTEEYLAGHVPGALHIPADDLPNRLEDIPRDRTVVTYCSMRHRGQSRSERAAALLRERGYDVQVLEGGLPAHEATGLPVERG
jgi:rhodanese-related sulfurtransferase